tara:strand:+ start:102 stop:707 length:606 start_codon:yes stop_codon:yes gene_type:complete
MPRKTSKKRTSKNIAKKYEEFMPTSNKITSKIIAPSDKGPISGIKNSIIISMIVSGIIGLLINVSALTWLHKLEEMNCACSEHWMRSYIKYYLYVIIPIFCIGLLINAYLYISDYSIIDLNNNDVFTFYKSFTNIVSLFGLANIIIVIIFINRLKEINCECSEDIKREIYWIYNMILASIIGGTLLFAMISALIVYMSFKR